MGERSHRSQGRESGQGDHFLEETEEFRCPEPCLGSGWTAFTHGILPTRRLKPSGGKDMPPTPGWPRFHTRCPTSGVQIQVTPPLGGQPGDRKDFKA